MVRGEVSRGYDVKNLVEGLYYGSKIRCASVDDLLKLTERYFKGCEPSKDALTDRLIHAAYSLEKVKEPIDGSKALKLLVVADLRSVLEVVNQVTLADPLEEVLKAFENYRVILSNHEIDVEETEVKVVDDFPGPYRGLDFMAMNIDADDEMNFGIRRGIYMKRGSIDPILSLVMLAHELIHSCVSSKPTGQLARGLEDGICDLLSFYLASKILPSNIVRNVLTNLRFAHPPSQFFEIYNEDVRQAVVIYKRCGLRGLMDLIRKSQEGGRGVIKSVEASLLRGRFDELDSLDRGGWDRELDEFTDYFLSFPRSMVVSPLACYLAEKVSKGAYLREVLRRNGIDLREGLKAAKELNRRVYLIVMDKGKVVYDETKAYVESGLLRYKP